MKDINLKHPYISVSDGVCTTYGGNQMLSSLKNMRLCGCGAVAALDLLVYLGKYHPDCSGCVSEALLQPESIAMSDYDRALIRLSRSFVPLIPGLGINGIMLALGLNTYFLSRKMPYAAFWGIRSAHFWEETEKMLEADIPVILSVGPNFPKLWGKKKLPFYRKTDGVLKMAAQTCAHYVTVTGIDCTYMTVSSWGKKFCISKAEYMDYIKSESSSLVSNIMHIKPLKRD